MEVAYLWDGHSVAEERRFGRKPDGKGGSGIIEESCATWDYEPDSFRPLAKTETVRRGGKETSKTYAVVLDHIGTPKELIDADGAIAWQARSNLWGEIEEITVSKTDCPIRFQGQYYDAESKLAYNWHRYYDASTARYLTPDPLGLAGGPNPYAYVDNPLSSIDPLGLMDCVEGGSNATAELSPGATLRQKYSHLAANERVALIESKAEANAFRRLQEMEGSTTKAHYLEKHGAQLDLQSQFDRAAHGINPTTGQLQYKPPAATRFLSHRDQLNVINRSESIFQATGDIAAAQLPIRFNSAIGSGYQKTTLNYGVQYSGQVYLNSSGKAVTAFPVWGQ